LVPLHKADVCESCNLVNNNAEFGRIRLRREPKISVKAIKVGFRVLVQELNQVLDLLALACIHLISAGSIHDKSCS
jgi:hypothetical protein